jgi:hypothetical protein
MFTDEHRRSVWEQIRQHDLRAFDRLLTPEVLAAAAARAGVAMGRGPLCLANLAWLSVSCALRATRNFADVLVMTLKLMRDADGWSRTPLAGRCRRSRRGRRRGSRRERRKHDPRPADPSVLSEEAFAQARSKAPAGYWVALVLLLGERFEAGHGPALRWGGHRLLALDGTTVRLANWRRLREHFGAAANGTRRRGCRKGKAGSRQPQARLVMLTFPLARLPWKYELCPLARSEKTCAASLLAGLGAGDLVLMDKGFWSYGLFCQIDARRAFFAVRLFKGVRLKTRARLGPDDRVARWRPSERKWKRAGLPRSMDLRVIRYRVPGFRPTALVTNLLDRRITRRRWVGLAAEEEAGLTLDDNLYHRRWEIETTFCELKVRQKMEGSLRGRTPEAVGYEVAGHVLLYLLVRWLIVEAAAKAGVKDPLRVSYLAALNELADIAPALLTATEARARRMLVPRLLARVASHVVPRRPGRHYPRPGDTKVKYKGRGHYRLPSKLKLKAGEA